ncbi:MAG: hypothetical protein KDK37_06610 [Leptospiraceae bacterium]|nr:hypothetical protein [Leptospiraceae bacterium]
MSFAPNEAEPLRMNGNSRAYSIGALVRRSWHFLAALGLVTLVLSCQSIPDGKTGESAESLADQMLAAASLEKWNNLQCVTFRFKGANRYVWDKKRGFVEYVHEDRRVLFSKNTFQAVAFDKGESITGEELKEALGKANASFINDSFWLQPAYHIRSPGTKLYYIDDHTLRVTFSSGGVTPGDTYVFHLDDKYRISTMEMWVSILPIPGVDADFSDYVDHPPGIEIAAQRSILVMGIPIDEVAFANAGGDCSDRFSPLIAAFPDLAQ